MKKILIAISCVLLVACSKSSNALKEITKSINNSNSYYLDGTLEVMNGDDSSFYNVKVSYKKDNFSLIDLSKPNFIIKKEYLQYLFLKESTFWKRKSQRKSNQKEKNQKKINI